MSRRWLLLLVLLLLAHPTRAQQLQGAHWFFGQHIGLDFTQGAPRFEAGGQTASPVAVAASVSDPGGRLLFYADHDNVWNRQHQLMPNGAGVGFHRRSGSTLAAPQPGRPNRYFLFLVSGGRLAYCLIDMALQGGQGDVLGSTIRTRVRNGVTESLTALPHANGADLWLVAHARHGQGFYAWLLTAQGLSTQPVSSHTGFALDSLFGGPGSGGDFARLKASPNGQRLALAVPARGLLQLFDFDQATGQVHTPRPPLVLSPGMPDTTLTGASFSPDSRRLYFTTLRYYNNANGTHSSLNQLDLTQPDSLLNASRQRLLILRGDSTPRILWPPQLGPDGRLYFASDTLSRNPPGENGQLNVMECPNERGAACRIRTGVVSFPAGQVGWYPPVLNETFFRNADRLQVVASNEQPCRGDTVRLTAFGAGTTSFTWAAAPHVPAGSTGVVQQFVADSTGTYLVTATRPCGPPLNAQVSITPQPRPAVPAISYSSGTLSTAAAGPWQWLLDDSPIFGATQPTYQPSQSGTYAVVVGSGCVARSAALNLQVTGLVVAWSDAAMQVWPNPSPDGRFTVEAELGATLTLTDALGRAISTTSPLEPGTSHLLPRPGLYLLRLTWPNGRIVTRKLVW